MAELTLEHLKSFYHLEKMKKGWVTGEPDPQRCAALVDSSDCYQISERQCNNPRKDGPYCQIHSKQRDRREG